jgi:hypothetical protein
VKAKVITLTGTALYYLIRYVVFQGLVGYAGIMTLAYILFYWPTEITPQMKGIIFGLATLSHIVWLFWRSDEWLFGENSNTEFMLLFLSRLPWSLTGAVGLTLLLMNSITVSGDNGLIETGLGYSLHPLSLTIPAMIVAGLYLGDSIGKAFSGFWVDFRQQKNEEQAAAAAAPAMVE